MVKKGFTFLNNLIPKKNLILFNSFPDYSDNALQLYLYIILNRDDILKKYKIIWTGNGNDSFPEEIKQSNIIRKKSVRGVLLFLRAKYIFNTHNYFSGIKSGNGQIQVNLWHGCGYKKLIDPRYHGDYTIATSDLYKNIQSAALRIEKDHVIVSGLPRNDLLIDNRNVLDELGIDKKKYNNIVIWMPTYRKAKLGHDGIDGDTDSFGVRSITDTQLDKLNTLLRLRHMLLIVKPHPMDSISLTKLNGNYSNICCITNILLKSREIKLYELISNCDGLLSDYSSVVTDFLILDRPIALVFSDVKQYKNSRGFVFDNIQKYLPGPVISNFDQLMYYFDNYDVVNKKWKNKRKKLSNLFEEYKDGKNSQRVCNYFFGKKP